MKLIIDIPNDFKDYIEDVLMGVGDSTGILVEAVMNGTPLEEELENIKTEIKEEQKRILTLDNGQYYVALCDFQKLLDNHIEELKGE